MKLEVLQENLSQAVSIASRFTNARAQLPVLGNIMLQASRNKLDISATNLEMGINVSIGAKVEKDGEVTVPARLINDIVNNLNKGTINIQAEKERVSIGAENFKSDVSGMNTSDFPKITKKIGTNPIAISSENLEEGLSKVLYAVSIDETRPVLTGVLISFGKEEVSLVSTDGFRLSKKRFKNNTSSKIKKNLIVPKNALSELLNITTENEINLNYDEKNNQILFSADGCLLSSRIINGEFPDYQKIIPKESQIDLFVDKTDLLQAVRLASVFARDSSNVIKFTVGKNNIKISAESQYSGSQTTEIETRLNKYETKKTLEIAFNYKFLQDFLGSVNSDEVEIKLLDANSPGIFLDSKDNQFIHLIMPVRIS